MSLYKQISTHFPNNSAIEACAQIVDCNLGTSRVPGEVDPLRIAKTLGIPVCFRRDCAFEGMLKRNANGLAEIVVREGQNSNRERFTIAHELGHYLIQQVVHSQSDRPVYRGVSESKGEVREEEYFANLLAAEILLPFSWMKKSIDAADSILDLIKSICKAFAVSKIMASRRVADVSGKNLITLSIVPSRFSKLNSAAVIDNAMFVTSGSKTLYARERTNFCEPLPFSALLNKKTNRANIDIDCPKGLVSSIYETEYRNTPVPHLMAATLIRQWPTTNQAYIIQRAAE